jgi:hypothetical protein
MDAGAVGLAGGARLGAVDEGAGCVADGRSIPAARDRGGVGRTVGCGFFGGSGGTGGIGGGGIGSTGAAS